jgi:hypothetical protein
VLITKIFASEMLSRSEHRVQGKGLEPKVRHGMTVRQRKTARLVAPGASVDFDQCDQ